MANVEIGGGLVPLKSSYIGRKVIVRTNSAGVHYGILEAKSGDEVRLTEARRIWKWTSAHPEAGACSGLAQFGIGEGSKIAYTGELEITGAIEIIPCTSVAIASIESGKWSS